MGQNEQIMNKPEVVDVVARVNQVTAYADQIASNFIQYDIIERMSPSGLHDLVKHVSVTMTTFGQIVKLLNEEAEAVKNGGSKSLFSHDGLQYVYTLATESGKALFLVEAAILDGSKRGKNAKTKSKRSTTKQVVNFAKLELQDETSFLEKVVKATSVFNTNEMDRIGDKIYDLNAYSMLLFQVVSVGKLSKDFSSGQVDVKAIAAWHKRTTATASLAGIHVPKQRHSSRYSDSDDSSYSGSSISSSSGSGSDSDDSLFAPRNRRANKTASKGRPVNFGPPCPPPPPPPNFPPPPPGFPGIPSGPPPPGFRGLRPGPPPGLRGPQPSVDWRGIPHPPVSISCFPQSQNVPAFLPPQTSAPKPVVMDTVKPPSYCESSGAAPINASTGEKVMSNADAKEIISAILSAESDTLKSSPASTDAKPKAENDSSNASKTKAVEPNIPNAQLFKSQSSGFGFKLRSMFRSNESLAAEMRATLESSQQRLSAFLVQGNGSRLVPHSVFHSLEATHMRTILSQINNKEWYKTFEDLNALESQTVQRTLYMNGNMHGPGRSSPAQLVVLKVVKENRLNEWVTLLNRLRQHAPFVLTNDGRVILVIVREKIVPPPPPMPFIPAPPRHQARQVSPPLIRLLPSSIRLAPSSLPLQQRNRISDLRTPAPPQGWPSGPPPSAVPPPKLNETTTSNPTTHAPDKLPSPDLAQNDEDALLGLTEYLEYSLRPCAPVEIEAARTWDRVSVTHESSPRHTIISRVHSFQRAGGDVINVKLSLTDQQSQQVTRVIDFLKNQERDFRFEWCWAEISKHGKRGEIRDLSNGGGNDMNSDSESDTDSDDELDEEVVMIHLIAKRTPKGHLKPLTLYNTIMSSPAPEIHQYPRPGMPGGPPGPVHHYGPPPPPPPPGRGVWVAGKPAKKRGDPRRAKKKGRKYVSETETETESGSGSGSGSESERSERAAKVTKSFRLKIKMNRGDDIVKILLDMWTPQNGNEGKEKKQTEK